MHPSSPSPTGAHSPVTVPATHPSNVPAGTGPAPGSTAGTAGTGPGSIGYDPTRGVAAQVGSPPGPPAPGATAWAAPGTGSAQTPIARAAAPAGQLYTGAYLPCGDPAIDRMVALERALKQFGSPGA